MTVYLLGCEGTRLVKIGHAADVRKRLRGISTMSAHPIRLLWQSAPEHGAETERRLHGRFRQYRQHGEWFDFEDADPVSLVSAAIDSEPAVESVVSAGVPPEVESEIARQLCRVSALAAIDPQAGALAAHELAIELQRVCDVARQHRRDGILKLVGSGWSYQDVANIIGGTRARVGKIVKPD